MEIECEMTLEKETKGAVRYAEKGEVENQLLKTLYIRKTAFKKGESIPKEIRVIVESLSTAKAESI